LKHPVQKDFPEKVLFRLWNANKCAQISVQFA